MSAKYVHPQRETARAVARWKRTTLLFSGACAATTHFVASLYRQQRGGNIDRQTPILELNGEARIIRLMSTALVDSNTNWKCGETGEDEPTLGRAGLVPHPEARLITAFANLLQEKPAKSTVGRQIEILQKMRRAKQCRSVMIACRFSPRHCPLARHACTDPLLFPRASARHVGWDKVGTRRFAMSQVFVSVSVRPK